MSWADALSELLNNPRELWAVAICAILGFWIVSKFFPAGTSGRQGGDDGPAQSDRARNSGAGSGGHNEGGDDPTQDERKRSSSEPRQWFEVLCVSPNASVADIKLAYRQRISEYHPDKVATLGAELKELAEKKSQAINEAYRVALLLRGR